MAQAPSPTLRQSIWCYRRRMIPIIEISLRATTADQNATKYLPSKNCTPRGQFYFLRFDFADDILMSRREIRYAIMTSACRPRARRLHRQCRSRIKYFAADIHRRVSAVPRLRRLLPDDFALLSSIARRPPMKCHTQFMPLHPLFDTTSNS
jgi:hypothetical protein